MSSTRLVFNKNSSQAVSDGVHKWEMCCFMVEMFTKYIGDKVMELVLQLNKVPSTPYSILSLLPFMLSLSDILLSSSITSELLPMLIRTDGDD